MESLVKRLEAVCARLEGAGVAIPAAAAGGAPAAPQAPQGGATSPSVEAFQSLVDEKVSKLVATAAAIGEADLVKTTGFLKAAFDEEAKVRLDLLFSFSRPY